MNHSFAYWCFKGLPDFDPEELFSSAVDMGYGGVEMVVGEQVAAAKAAGLTVLNAAGPGMQKGLNRLSLHETILPDIERGIKECHAQGIGALIIFSGNREGQSDADGIDACTQGVRSLLSLCEALDVSLWFELFNVRDHVDYQADSTAYGVELWRNIDHSHFKLLYDVYHMERQGELVFDDIRQHHRAFGHIHCADHESRGPITEANGIDYAQVGAALDQAGYSGYVGQEFTMREGWTMQEALDALEASLQVIQQRA